MAETEAVAKISNEAFLLFDREDDQQIIARIKGAALKEYVYAFPAGKGQMIYGLGVDGAEAAKRELARSGEVIREDAIIMEKESVDYAFFQAKASRWAVKPGAPDVMLDTTIELKRQAKFTTRRDGRQEPNEFWYEQGGSKAMRNAILNLVPEEIKQKVILAYKDQAKVVEAPAGSEVNEALGHEYHQAFKDKDERDGLVAEIHNLWHELQATAGWIKGVLREAGLNEALSHPKADWSTVSLAAITDLRDSMRKAGTR